MLYWIGLIAIITIVYAFYRYYYKPKSEIKRYKALFQKLGYQVYEQTFAFLSFSFAVDYEKGIRTYRDSRYI